MASHLDFDGKYDAERRFVVSNWLATPHESFWDSKPITIPAGGMYECEHAIAYKLTKEIVDKAMFAHADEEFKKAGGDSAYAQKVRERAEMSTLSKDLRKPYEDKTLAEIKAGEENPIMSRMREQIRREEQAKLSNELAVNTPPQDIPIAPQIDIPLTVPTTPKRGRPARPKGEFNGAETI